MGSRRSYRAIAEYYDAENAHHRVLEEDVPFFLGQLPHKRLDILEMAVGTARAAIPLAQAGHRVVGVDYAADMLEIARRKRDGVGLGEKELALIEADALSLDLGRKFDWVCVFFNTFLAFTTLEQQDAVLQRALAHLKPKGRFWLDVFQPDMRLLSEPRRHELDPSVFFVPRFDRTVLKTTETRRASTPQLQHVTFHYTWFGPHGQPHHERTRFDMTYIFPRELRLLLDRNGMEIERLWGNYDGSELAPESPRMIVRCCRA
ncbi:MAG TPA: class I SAM-dependent methyltransferase [Tepidisphaeraceae bacterium]|jgi:SAM-dependent methyltransferase|nr:class I SAM-dependent methyltransferase [Tepidisphaeraceae bacterium]